MGHGKKINLLKKMRLTLFVSSIDEESSLCLNSTLAMNFTNKEGELCTIHGVSACHRIERFVLS